MDDEKLYDEYDYCLCCGEHWDKHTKGELIDDDGNYEAICNPLTVVMNHKPRFYVQDLEYYNEVFLKQIILWQDSYIKYLENKNII